MRLKLLAIVLLAFIAGAGLAILANPDGLRQWFAGSGTTSTGEALIGGPFRLVDHDGRRVTESDFFGKPMLVFFGFTYCPDVCPAGLQTLSAVLQALGPKADRLTVLFITVDPARDTAPVLKDYLANFDARIRGLTGTEDEIAAVLRAYRIYARKVEDAASAGAYTMDHTSLIYLMDRGGRYAAHFAHAQDPAALAQRISSFL
jgi:protein SCO1/2